MVAGDLPACPRTCTVPFTRRVPGPQAEKLLLLCKASTPLPRAQAIARLPRNGPTTQTQGEIAAPCSAWNVSAMPAPATNTRLATIRLDPNADLLRRPEALDLFAKLYADDLSAAELVDWCVWKECVRLERENSMDRKAAHAAIVLQLALDAPGVILAALSAEDPGMIVLRRRLVCLGDLLESRKHSRLS